MPIHIRYGDKALLVGVLYVNRGRVWGVMRIDINNVGPPVVIEPVNRLGERATIL
jgi:hypothetical protein